MTDRRGQPWLGFALMITITTPIAAMTNDAAVTLENARHLTVFREKGRFAGWPANNGIWQWGNEILVGFSVGFLAPPKQQGLHQIDPGRPQSIMLARSLDGGETWSVAPAGYPEGEPDIGYTRTVQRPDGKLVTVYYWLDEPRGERFIAATIWPVPRDLDASKKIFVR